MNANTDIDRGHPGSSFGLAGSTIARQMYRRRENPIGSSGAVAQLTS